MIQTAFIGDVILGTAVLEKLHATYPEAQLDMLVRKGNESLLADHPYLRETLVWNKQQSKWRNLFAMMRTVRAKRYDLVVNLHRFSSSGLICFASRAGEVVGFEKNPLSWSFSKRFPHQIGDGTHETERNQVLIAHHTGTETARPKLYPSEAQKHKVKTYQEQPYITIAPTSVWFTKQVPAEKWLELIASLPTNLKIYLLGAPADRETCEQLVAKAQSHAVQNLAGSLSLLESAALMAGANMNYVNDSAPMHLASAMNAPVTAYFCSTIPAFGFTPRSDVHRVVETAKTLDCRPCGLHGFKQCPKGHFRCAHSLPMAETADA